MGQGRKVVLDIEKQQRTEVFSCWNHVPSLSDKDLPEVPPTRSSFLLSGPDMSEPDPGYEHHPLWKAELEDVWVPVPHKIKHMF